jgi:hypothetical protein
MMLRLATVSSVLLAAALPATACNMASMGAACASNKPGDDPTAAVSSRS